jgi:hypothetical protein
MISPSKKIHHRDAEYTEKRRIGKREKSRDFTVETQLGSII